MCVSDMVEQRDKGKCMDVDCWEQLDIKGCPWHMQSKDNGKVSNQCTDYIMIILCMYSAPLTIGYEDVSNNCFISIAVT